MNASETTAPHQGTAPADAPTGKEAVPVPAIDPRLVVLGDDPLNAETPPELQTATITPDPLFFYRNRFSMPDLAAETWAVVINGNVDTPLQITLEQLKALPAKTITVTTECAGNGRSGMSPPADGEPWGWGAVSTARWTGVPLAAVLEPAGIRPETLEILAVGADGGVVESGADPIPFARSVPLAKALHPDTLLVYEMNGRPLPRAHGHPVRLIVPGWYGMASIKWVTRISALREPFDGYFQRERYVVPADSADAMVQLREMRVRSLITSPAHGDVVPRQAFLVGGLAWSGHGEVQRVDVSLDSGKTWHPARWTEDASPYAWRRWEFPVTEVPGGPLTIMSRATDATGEVQPESPPWNRLGYANNAVRPITVSCT